MRKKTQIVAFCHFANVNVDSTLVVALLLFIRPPVYGSNGRSYKKLSCCWETVRRESMPRIAEVDVEMTT